MLSRVMKEAPHGSRRMINEHVVDEKNEEEE